MSASSSSTGSFAPRSISRARAWLSGYGANRNDSVMLEPTLDDAAARGLLSDIQTIWLDRGYDSDVTRERLAERLIKDSVIAKKRKRGSPRTRIPNPGACAGRSSAPTRGYPISVSCGGTRTARTSTALL